MALLPDRQAPAPAIDTAGCRPGFVWRQAAPEDLVCVGYLSRDRIALENRLAASRRDPLAPPGSSACRDGLVWRLAVDGDTVCVTPRVRDRVREENVVAPHQDRSFRQAATIAASMRGVSGPAAAR